MTAFSNFDLVINQALNTLLVDEFNIPVKYQPVFRKQDIALKGEYIRYYSNGSEITARLSNHETRDYNYQLSYYYQYAGDQHKSIFEKTISERTNQMYYFLMTKSSYYNDGYKWHEIKLTYSPVIWGIEDQEEETPNIGRVDFEMLITRGNDIPSSPTIVDGGDIV